MDVRKNNNEALAPTPNADVASDGSAVSPASPERASFAHALEAMAIFSNGLLALETREGIRAHVEDTVRRLLGVETAEIFFDATERRAGDHDCVAAVRGASGLLATIRAADRLDWVPFTAADAAILDSLATTLGLRLENLRLAGELVRQQASSVQALAAAIEVKDRYTSGHTKRVGAYADAIVRHLPIVGVEKEKIRLAGVLHDIGKIGVPDRILLKPDRLTEAEWDEMRLHTEAGFDIVSRVAGLEEIAEILRHHHERWDGSGYPRGLKGMAIPFASRVIAVADTFDAIVTDRPYRRAMPPSEAREIIVGHSGTHFDPVVVAAFEAAFSDLEASALGRDEI